MYSPVGALAVNTHRRSFAARAGALDTPTDWEALHWLLRMSGEVAEWLKALAC